jgi:hypothetical protein
MKLYVKTTKAKWGCGLSSRVPAYQTYLVQTPVLQKKKKKVNFQKKLYYQEERAAILLKNKNLTARR